MARYRRRRYAQSANFAKAKAASAHMSATGGRSFAIKRKKKRPSDDGLFSLCLAIEIDDIND